MCTNFINLNKACLKESYPLPSIDWLVDETLSYNVPYILDAYSKYN